MTSIYSTKEGMAYQCGSTRALVDAKGCAMFQKKIIGQWINGRHSYARDLIDKVKKQLSV